MNSTVRVAVLNDEVVAEHVITTISCPLKGWEQAWDACGRESGLVEIIDTRVVLIKKIDSSSLDVDG